MNIFKSFCTFLLLNSITIVAVDGQVIDALEYKTLIFSIRANPFENGEVQLLESWIKERENLNKSYLYSLDPERLLYNFRKNAGIFSKALPLEGWESPKIGLRGHFTGHFLSACASVIQQYGDTTLKKRIDYMVDELSICQQKLGGKYLSAFPESDFFTLEKKYGEVWAPYYTYHKIMQGLLDVYTKTGNKKAFQLVLNMAAFVEDRMANLSEDQIDKIFFTAAANPPNEAGGMNEVLQNLYAITKDRVHFKLASIFDRKWFSYPLSKGDDILSGLHSNTHIVLINGYAKRFENSGDIYYRDAAINFWQMLMNHHTYINGSSSGPRPIATTPTSRTAEHWGIANQLAATLSGQTGESCVSHNTQKLTATLFSWTTAAEYADSYMNMFYNAILPIQNQNDGRNVYHLPLGSPQKKEFLKENDYRCCNGTGIEAFSSLNKNIFFHKKDSLWVNLYIPSKLNWIEKGIQVSQVANFTTESKSKFIINTSSPKFFTLKLFIPSWAKNNVQLIINGKSQKVHIKALSYLTIHRKWFDNDTVELMFAFDMHYKTMPDDNHVLAFMYGPILLAFETDKELILKGAPASILSNLKKMDSQLGFTLKNNGVVYSLLPFYEVSDNNYGVYATIRNKY